MKDLERSREEQRRKSEEQQRLAEEQRREAEVERTRIVELRRGKGWQEARVIRAYLGAYRAARQEESDSEGLVDHAWLIWAEKFVDSLDPLGP